MCNVCIDTLKITGDKLRAKAEIMDLNGVTYCDMDANS